MDPNPLLVNIPVQLQIFKKLFQFFNFMIDLPQFQETVAGAWRQLLFGEPMAILCRRLKYERQALIELNKKMGIFIKMSLKLVLISILFKTRW